MEIIKSSRRSCYDGARVVKLFFKVNRCDRHNDYMIHSRIFIIGLCIQLMLSGNLSAELEDILMFKESELQVITSSVC